MGNLFSTTSEVDLQPGDLLEFFRRTYKHWAVYIGDGLVVHLETPLESSGEICLGSINCDKALVTQAEVLEVKGKDKMQINNILDSKCTPRPADHVVREARGWVGRTRPYCLITSNCEHFATELRYGRENAKSRQVRWALTEFVTGGLGGLFAGIWFFGRSD